MELNVCKGTKTDFSYLVGMALQRRMTWKALEILLIDVAPTLNETREVISILLKELENLHCAFEKNKEVLKKYEETETLIDGERVIDEAKHQKEAQDFIEDSLKFGIGQRDTYAESMKFMELKGKFLGQNQDVPSQ